MELCYTNNPKSLFRKYRKLITSLTRHQLFRDYLSIKGLEIPKKTALLLPNGFVEFDGKQARMTVTPRSPFSPKLYPALKVIDNVQMFLKDFDEATQILAWQLGLSRNIPDILKRFHFASLTVNPDVDPESTSVDGSVTNSPGTNTWATIRNATDGTAAQDTAGNAQAATINTSTTLNEWLYIQRAAFLFDASAMGAGATVSAGTLSLYGTAVLDELGSQSVCIVTSSPASNTAITTADYDQFGTTKQNSSDITLAAWNTAGYNDFALNATGVSNITVGICKFGQRNVADQANAEPTYASDKRSSTNLNYADVGSNKPKLVITYTPVVGGDENAYFLLAL